MFSLKKKKQRRVYFGSHSQYTPSWLKAWCFGSHTHSEYTPRTLRIHSLMTKGLALRDSLWAGCQMRKHREVKAASCVLTPFHCGTLPMGEYCPRWGLVFPPRVKSLWKHPHRSTQNTVSWVTLNPQAQCKVRSSLTLHCFHLGQRSQLVSLLLNLVTDVRRIKEDAGNRIPLKGGSSFPESLCSLPPTLGT